MLLAIPVTAVISVFASEWMQRYQNSELFSKFDQQRLSEHAQAEEEAEIQPEAIETDTPKPAVAEDHNEELHLIQLDARTLFFSHADYLSVLEDQQYFHQQIRYHDGVEVVLTGTHTACITLGKRGGEVDPSLNLPVHKIGRGGLATWHGPGQLVVYPIIDIKNRRIGARNWVRLLERITLDWLQCWGVSAMLRESCPGLWIATAKGHSKIASIGLELKGGISTHGISINLELPETAFNGIAACGFSNIQHTDLRSERPQVLQIRCESSCPSALYPPVERASPLALLHRRL